MLNVLWGAMILVGITYGAMTGHLGAVTDGAISSAKEAVMYYHVGDCGIMDGNHGDCKKFWSDG